MHPTVILRHEEAKEQACKRIRAIKADPERPYAVYIAPYQKIRSLEANAYYWRLVGMVADATGHSRDTLHTYFKREALGVRIERIGDKEIEIVPSSAKLSVGDFARLIEYVSGFISEHGISESA